MSTDRATPTKRERIAIRQRVKATDGSGRRGIVTALRDVQAHRVVSVRLADGRTCEIPEWNVRPDRTAAGG